jgi:hypothetical protein
MRLSSYLGSAALLCLNAVGAADYETPPPEPAAAGPSGPARSSH